MDMSIILASQRRLIAAAQPAAPPSTRRPKEQENMNDFIAKKREIFLVQMSLDTKRAEITKLEERALQVPSLLAFRADHKLTWLTCSPQLQVICFRACHTPAQRFSPYYCNQQQHSSLSVLLMHPCKAVMRHAE